MSSARNSSGLSLLELIIGLSLAAIVALFTFQGYIFGTREWGSQNSRILVQQNLRTAVDLLMRESRLGGACLPDAGPLTAFDGIDQTTGGRDTDVLVVHANNTCAKGTLTRDQATPGAPLDVDVTTGFAAGQRAYILHQDTTVGEFFIIETVTPTSITPEDPLSRAYTRSSSIFGIEEKAFGIDAGGTVPTLTIDPTYLSGGPPVPIVRGIESLNLRYILNRRYADDPGSCLGATPDGWCIVNPPGGGSADWGIVRELEVTLTARSLQTVTPGDPDGYLRLPASARIKPRNLISP